VDDTQTAKLFKHRGSHHLGAKIGITIVLHTWARRHAPAAGADNADRLPLGRRDDDRLRQYAAELVGLAPAVILAAGGATVRPLRRSSHAVPIVFKRPAPGRRRIRREHFLS
jgi:hypothetical protein